MKSNWPHLSREQRKQSLKTTRRTTGLATTHSWRPSYMRTSVSISRKHSLIASTGFWPNEAGFEHYLWTIYIGTTRQNTCKDVTRCLTAINTYSAWFHCEWSESNRPTYCGSPCWLPIHLRVIHPLQRNVPSNVTYPISNVYRNSNYKNSQKARNVKMYLIYCHNCYSQIKWKLIDFRNDRPQNNVYSTWRVTNQYLH